MHLPTWIRTNLTVMVTAIAVALLGLAAAFALLRAEENARTEAGNALQTVLQTSHEAFRRWATEIRREAGVWANVPAIRLAAEELLEAEKTPASLIGSPAQTRIRASLRPLLEGTGYRGFFLIAPDSISLASTRDANTGVPNLTVAQPEFLRRILAGETALSLPQTSDVPLPNASGELRENMPTMFVGAPVRNDADQVIAALTFRIDPADVFTAIFQRGRLGNSGETYAFNQRSQLISESRFDEQLREIGLIGPDQRGILNISLHDPGVDLVEADKHASPLDRKSLTLVAQSAIAGKSGMNLDGYRDYRGAEVVGAWLWDDEYKLGIATEMSIAEIYRRWRETQFVFAAFAALAGIAMITLAATFEIARRRILRARKALEESEQYYRWLMENAAAGIGRTPVTDGSILIANQKLAEIFGYDTPEELMREFSFVRSEADRVRRDRLIARLRQDPVQITEKKFVRRDGSSVVVTGYDKLHPSGEWIDFMMIDITENKTLEDRMRESQKIEVIGRLAGGVAHDFNNLFAVVVGNAEFLNEKMQGNSAQRSAAAIIRAGNRGASLTQQLLSYSRKQTLSPRPTDISELIAGIRELLQSTLGVAVELHTDIRTGGRTVSVDRSEFENALINLALNARDAMPNGGKLSIEASAVTLDERAAAPFDGLAPGDYCQIIVSDTGTGIPPDVLPKAFEPFFTTKDVGRGSGLGLSMVYGFAKQAGGHATIESELEYGTVVRLYLPLSARENDRETEPVWPSGVNTADEAPLPD